MILGIHSCFAANLRQLCFRYRTITEVCDGIRINRQQFNKYLAGSSLPNSSTLQRICNFLGVREEELFQAGEQWSTGHHALGSDPGTTGTIGHLKALYDTLAVRRHGNLGATTSPLLPGLYHCYFPLQNNSEFLLRTLVLVKRDEFGTSFTRLTLFPSTRGCRNFLARAKHYGLIIANNHEVYFVGMNQSPPHQMSFISMELASGKMPSLLTGLAVVGTSTGTMSARVCLQRLGGNTSAKNAIRMLGPIPSSCGTVPTLIRSAMAACYEQYPNQLAGVSYSQLLVRSMTLESLQMSA